MKKCISVLLMLAVLLSVSAAALAAPVCGNEEHSKDDGLDHSRPQSCWVTGHFSCDGQDHAKAECGCWGHFNCDPKPHNAAECGAEGHYVCDGKTHAAAACGIEGHCIADGKKHVAAACGIEGHNVCEGGASQHKLISKYCNAEPQHYACQTETDHYCDPAQGGCGQTYACKRSNAHTECASCGLLWCDHSLGSHYTPCGKVEHRPCAYTLRGAKYDKYDAEDHEQCKYCLQYECDNWGYHGAGKCVKICKACGEAKIQNQSHRYACGEHYSCVEDELSHKKCADCGYYKCSAEHAAKCARK